MKNKIFNVLDYGAKADGLTLDTLAVQKAIDQCNTLGGGTVYFPDGEYVLSTVFLKSNVKILISSQATVFGSLNFYDYASDENVDYPLYQDASHSFFNCSMFVGKNCENIAVTGDGKIDMRSVWDKENIRNMAYRGAKCIALKNCKKVEISNLGIYNVTDLAVYFAGCENVDIYDLKMRVYIDGISPDNCKNVRIHDCDLETGDDGIVFKSSYTLNRLDICKNISVWDCRVKSRCNAIKFGTETNGGFEDISIEDINICDTRICGIAIESVDGAIIDGITIKNIEMKNVNAPIFIHLGKRMRGPEGSKIGEIKNILLENIKAEGPYRAYDIIAWNYDSYMNNDFRQYPWNFDGKADFDYTKIENCELSNWQMTSNVCGLKGYPLKNIVLHNISLKLDGGIEYCSEDVPEEPRPYPEVYTYGKFLPAKGIYFRHINGLTLDNVTVETYREDVREDFVFDDVK